MDPPSMHAKLLDVNVTPTLHGTQFDVDLMCLEANLVSSQFSKLTVVNGNMDSSGKGNSVLPLHENGPSSAKVVPVNDSYVDIRFDLSLDLSTGQVSSFSRLETILESSTTSRLISDVCSTVPIQAILVIDSLV
ncbi:hypothetical protein LWI28_016414 [Acer negundo]|uniref:Uncharacterized protein n=1 Tax=Acer negundo TaxID=4023 RepID=A0AAD5NSB8_ACENE|nr:hypothetical protein LWI28_016414 [Acer negundo]KAK4845680.1 hypothetical protein QYF36_007768 [Acer negundo]